MLTLSQGCLSSYSVRMEYSGMVSSKLWKLPTLCAPGAPRSSSLKCLRGSIVSAHHYSPTCFVGCCADWHTEPAPCTCPFNGIGRVLMSVEIPPCSTLGSHLTGAREQKNARGRRRIDPQLSTTLIPAPDPHTPPAAAAPVNWRLETTATPPPHSHRFQWRGLQHAAVVPGEETSQQQ